ncbi:DUF6241 domain-containing protein [Bacillus sp. AK031]
MTKAKKTALFILIILLLVTVSAGSIFIYFNEKGAGGNFAGNNNSEEFEGEETQPEGDTENPFGEPFLSPLNEGIIQQYIHAMSHQKVEADKKWSFYRMTDERILYLLGELDKGDYKHEQIYRDILIKWHEGNFSEADHDHNEIWTMLGGTVGRAEGLLSNEEEQAYLRKQKTEQR